VLAKWLLQQNQNLILLECAGLKPTDDKVFSIGTHLDIHSHMLFFEVQRNWSSLVVATTESKSAYLVYVQNLLRITFFPNQKHALSLMDSP
jgi:hypothetical protein